MVLGVRPVEACGGFFCSRVPVDQSGEHLLFGIEDDGTVVAHIQIQYQGAAESFAWVLPLPAEPEVGIGSDEIFRTLRAVTDPTFTVDWRTEGQCEQYDRDYGADADSDADADADADVSVLQQGPVGPYQSAVIQSADAQAVVDWLGDNDYDVPALSLPEIASYTNANYVFLALRLLKDRSVGDLAPVVVRFAESGPCIPLRLTAIAAQPDMPIYAWVLAEGRAVSTNFLEVEPNWAAIDWLRGGYDYGSVVRRAVDEATGRAFVTEYAGTARKLQRVFWFEGRYRLEPLRTLDDPIEFVDEIMAQGFSGNSQMLELLRRFIPKPEELADVDDQSFYNCLPCYAEAIAQMAFDPNAFADAIQETIIDPLIEAQAMADRHPYLTRLYTAISPEEMTEDPIFRFNLDLGDVSNEHRAQAVRMCQPDLYSDEAPVALTLPDGTVMYLDGSGPPPSSFADMPASVRAWQRSETGPGVLHYDNEDAIAEAVGAYFGPPESLAGGGCAVVPVPAGGAAAWGLVLLGLMVTTGALARRSGGARRRAARRRSPP